MSGNDLGKPRAVLEADPSGTTFAICDPAGHMKFAIDAGSGGETRLSFYDAGYIIDNISPGSGSGETERISISCNSSPAADSSEGAAGATLLSVRLNDE